MSQTLEAFLAQLKPVAEDTENWNDGMRLVVSCYITSEPPPSEVVSSVRAVVMREDTVLAISNPLNWATGYRLYHVVLFVSIREFPF